ncbi:MAG: DMT family transporter [Sulfuricellaceae bacterium]
MASKQKVLAVSALLFGATTWGLVWYPYRLLELSGVSGALSCFFTYSIPLLVGVVFFRRQLSRVRDFRWMLLGIGFTAGWTNLAYVLAILHGEVMRVLLLFYLSPLWTVIFARLLLNERPNRYGYLVIGMAFAGAVTMLWQSHLGAPLPRNSAEWLALSAGLTFAAINVLSRRGKEIPVNLKSLSVWAGVSLLSLLAMAFYPDEFAVVSRLAPADWTLLLALGAIMFLVTVITQYGLAHTPANQAIVIFLFELVVAAVSSYFLANEALGVREWLGGALIVAATLFSGKLEQG